MAKLYFYYSAMNAGKSTHLLQAAYNYEERGQRVLLLSPSLDDRFGLGKITSRIGLQRDAIMFQKKDDLKKIIRDSASAQATKFDCILVDEAQFLTENQVEQLSEIVDRLNVPVMCYGLRTDSFGRLFDGSARLLGWADELNELKTICFCGRKASMVVRYDQHGDPVTEGDQIEIGGNDAYVSMCRHHWREALAGRLRKQDAA